jgi:hypothetical protein
VRASTYLDIAFEDQRLRLDNPVALHDALVAQGGVDRAHRLWQNTLRDNPESMEGRLFAAWTDALTGGEAGVAEASRYASEDPPPPLAIATLAYASLVDAQHVQAMSHVERLCRVGSGGREAYRRLMGALERYDMQHPGGPWVYCLTARILAAKGLSREAALAVDLCEARCADNTCEQSVTALRTHLAAKGN